MLSEAWSERVCERREAARETSARLSQHQPFPTSSLYHATASPAEERKGWEERERGWRDRSSTTAFTQ